MKLRRLVVAAGVIVPAIACIADPRDRPFVPLVDDGGGVDAADVGVIDAGDTCVPHDVSAFSPSWRVPIGPKTGACSLARIAELQTKCFAPETSTPLCDVFSSEPPCFLCLSTDVTAEPRGPIRYFRFHDEHAGFLPNAGGCVALIDADVGAASCGARVDALEACASFACKHDGCPSAPIGGSNPTQAEYERFLACRATAKTGVCASYKGPAETCLADLRARDGGGAIDACLGAGLTAGAYFGALATLACGPP